MSLPTVEPSLAARQFASRTSLSSSRDDRLPLHALSIPSSSATPLDATAASTRSTSNHDDPSAHAPLLDPNDPDHLDNGHMNRRTKSKPSKRASSSSIRSRSSTPATSPTHPNGDMTSPLDHRQRKWTAADGDSSSQSAELMSRDTFTLDDRPALAADHDSPDNGFFDLPPKDRSNFLLLVLLYFLQGIPMGLATGSVPFLLKSKLSYGQIGIFSLASYPYSLKLLWSPIVDSVWSPKVGRRKSWILPVQAFSGISMLWLGSRVESMMEAAGANGGEGVWTFTWWWFFLVFTCATQDIAVDGWALTLLSQQNLSYASTAQTVGLTGGQFLSYTVFLALNAPDFANRWLRTSPSSEGLLTLPGYLAFWGWAYLVVTLGLALLKKEDRTKERDSIGETYRVMGGILKLKNVQAIIVIHLIAKIGFQANEAVTNLKLIDKGFSQEDLALAILIDFPFELGLGYYAGKWSSVYPPMHLWCWAFIGRLIAAGFAQFTVMMFPSSGQVGYGYLGLVIVEHVFSTFMSTVMFVAVSAFHAKIADPVIGGTYMTLLATVSNLGGTFPRFFVLKLVDSLTSATCIPPSTPPKNLADGISPITAAFSCALEADKHQCIAGGGTCEIQRDGYYYVNVLCIIIGVATFWSYIRPASLRLQALPLSAWRLAGRS